MQPPWCLWTPPSRSSLSRTRCVTAACRPTSSVPWCVTCCASMPSRVTCRWPCPCSLCWVSVCARTSTNRPRWVTGSGGLPGAAATPKTAPARPAYTHTCVCAQGSPGSYSALPVLPPGALVHVLHRPAAALLPLECVQPSGQAQHQSRHQLPQPGLHHPACQLQSLQAAHEQPGLGVRPLPPLRQHVRRLPPRGQGALRVVPGLQPRRPPAAHHEVAGGQLPLPRRLRPPVRVLLTRCRAGGDGLVNQIKDAGDILSGLLPARVAWSQVPAQPALPGRGRGLRVAGTNSSSWSGPRPAPRKRALLPGRRKRLPSRSVASRRRSRRASRRRVHGAGGAAASVARALDPGGSRPELRGGRRRRVVSGAGRGEAGQGARRGGRPTEPLCRQAEARAGGAGGRDGGGALHCGAPGRPQLRRVCAAVLALSCGATPPGNLSLELSPAPPRTRTVPP